MRSCVVVWQYRLAILLVGTACAPARLPRLVMPFERLPGVWSLRLTAGPDSFARTSDRDLRGQLIVDQNQPLRLLGGEGYGGWFAVDLTPYIGYDLAAKRPAARILLYDMDSVRIQLGPLGGARGMDSDDGSVHARGVLAGDSIAGTWSHSVYDGGRAGTFTMHRLANREK